MNLRFAVVTSPKEVEQFFTGERWKRLTGPSKFETNIHDEYYYIRLSPGEETFDVRIEAIDDPSDSDATDEPTTDPLAFVSKFLRQDDAGDLSRISFDPGFFSRRLKLLATQKPSSVQRVLRRAMVLISDRPSLRMAKDQDLVSEIKKKGWEIEEETEQGVVFIVSDVYRVTVRPMGVEWEYQFEVQGQDSATVHGKTQDPIIKYREWYKKDATVEAVRSAKAERTEKKRLEDEARDSQETVRPMKKPAMEEADTESP